MLYQNPYQSMMGIVPSNSWQYSECWFWCCFWLGNKKNWTSESHTCCIYFTSYAHFYLARNSYSCLALSNCVVWLQYEKKLRLLFGMIWINDIYTLIIYHSSINLSKYFVPINNQATKKCTINMYRVMNNYIMPIVQRKMIFENGNYLTTILNKTSDMFL